MSDCLHLRLCCFLSILLCLSLTVFSKEEADTANRQPLRLHGEAIANAGTGDFAPYFIASNSGGINTQAAGTYARLSAIRDISSSGRFNFGFGADILAGYFKSTDYKRYTAEGKWTENPQHPANFQIEQLYAEARYRSLFLSAGMKENTRSLFDSPLSSGDITLSRNARAVPQIRLGFFDFQNIPLTRGWVQIRGEIAYGKMMDNSWLRNHYSRYTGFLTTGSWMHHASVYFRTNPKKPFYVTLGIQHAGQFGGTYEEWFRGEITRVEKTKPKVSTFFKMLIPHNDGKGSTDGDRNYYEGNHLGSWDLILTYRFPDGSRIVFSWQSPWEDGSGIGKQNGWDGVYGLEFRMPQRGPLTAVRAEYLDFRNQSGPMHWAPDDHPGSGVNGDATGNDNYYNNFFYNGWANYGMSLGTPFLLSPVYNRNGQLLFLHNKVYGFHAGIEGTPVAGLDYRVLYTWRKSSGSNDHPTLRHKESTSMLFECKYRFPRLKCLSVKAQAAFDSGSLCGGKFGMLIGVAYTGNLNLNF